MTRSTTQQQINITLLETESLDTLKLSKKTSEAAELLSLKEEAYSLYACGIRLSDISLRLKVRQDILASWHSSDEWDARKISNELNDPEKFLAVNSPEIPLKLSSANAIILLKKNLEKLLQKLNSGEEGDTLSIRELQQLTQIIETLQKVSRLEKGLATDILETRGLSVEEANAIIRADPFAKRIVKAEVVNKNVT